MILKATLFFFTSHTLCSSINTLFPLPYMVIFHQIALATITPLLKTIIRQSNFRPYLKTRSEAVLRQIYVTIFFKDISGLFTELALLYSEAPTVTNPQPTPAEEIPASVCPMSPWQEWSSCDGECEDGKVVGYRWRERYHLVDGIPVEKYDPHVSM